MAKKKDRIPSYIQAQREEVARLALMFENIASTIFLWEGLPPGLRSGWIERRLFWEGQLVFFEADFQKEQTAGFLMLPLARDGEINVYSEPVHYHAISPLKSFYRDFSNAVLVRNNEMRLPTKDLIFPLLEEMADIRIAMRVNRNASCKTPIIVRTSENQRLTVMNQFQEISGNKPIILVDEMNVADRIGYDSNTLPPYWGRELREEYENVKSEVLTILGVINNPVEKRERVNTIEASSNRGEIVDNIDSGLTYRQAACDEINEMFGASMAAAGIGPISVKLNNKFTEDMIQQGLVEETDADRDDKDNEEGDEE